MSIRYYANFWVETATIGKYERETDEVFGVTFDMETNVLGVDQITLRYRIYSAFFIKNKS